MTQDPQLSAEKVAELEHRLADAAAEVAKVQAQLAAARPPETPVPGQPHVITVNGQPLTPGSGQLASMLQTLVGQGGGTPVVVVNGQTVSGGQSLDPQVAERVRSSLAQLGLDHQFGAMFGAPPPAPPPGPTVGLAEPPRPVPFAYRLATFDISFYELFLLVILTAAPVAVWVFAPVVVPAGLIAAVLVIAAFRGQRYVRRIRLLKWGKVATVVRNDTLSAGTYYGGTTYNNMRKRQATGWDMSTIWYSGPGYTNKVDYTLDGVSGSLKYRGLLYTDGVVLADSRDASKAMTVSQFPYSIKPGPDGQFTGRLSPWQYVGIVVTVFVETSLVCLAVLAVLQIWLE